jgi:hypothetical protein
MSYGLVMIVFSGIAAHFLEYLLKTKGIFAKLKAAEFKKKHL